jgi:DNA-binding HxlR family transcriptional regulator
VRERRRGKLAGRVRWPSRRGADSGPGKPGSDGPDGGDASKEQRSALNWRVIQARLGPVRHRWDLAILCNLDETAGCRPADLLTAINSQAETGRQLSPQVLSGRLRDLEHGGYIRHVDLSVLPLHRVYYLQPPGQGLLSDLARITGPDHSVPEGTCAAGHSSAIRK